MATKQEFAQWFEDFSARWPTIGDYLSRHSDRRLLDTWQRTCEPFTMATLTAVTLAMMDGRLLPIPNTNLGTFGEEIRQRCRQIIEEDAPARERAETTRQHQRAAMTDRTMRQSVDLSVACAELLTQNGIELDKYGMMYLLATATLADDHTPAEEERALAQLAETGITWEQIQERAELVALRENTLFKTITDPEQIKAKTIA